MPPRQVVDRIIAFHSDRIPALVALKYQEMALDALGFFRGSCHIFYEDLPCESLLQDAPAVWVCGDLHLQNFGCFKGDDRLVYFDINDFDEALLAPTTWDLVRFVTSIFVAGPLLKLTPSGARALAERFLSCYTAALYVGKARTVKQERSIGLVHQLIESVRMRDRANFLKARVSKSGDVLKRIDQKVTDLPESTVQNVRTWVKRWAQNQANPEFFQVLDVAGRIAGNGSLGLERYLVLVAGKGKARQRYLLDLKAARSSALRPKLSIVQPQWNSEADRIISIQNHWQESPPAMLSQLSQGLNIPSVGTGSHSYTVRELQPTADKIDLLHSRGKSKRLGDLVQTMAEVTAWGQLRSSGRQGSAIADELIEFADRGSVWQPIVLDYAETYAAQVQQDHQTFATSLLST